MVLLTQSRMICEQVTTSPWLSSLQPCLGYYDQDVHLSEDEVGKGKELFLQEDEVGWRMRAHGEKVLSKAVDVIKGTAQ